LFCFVEEEENALQNQSLTSYPLVYPEFWQHYYYLKKFHDLHTSNMDYFQYQQQQYQQQMQRFFTSADVDYVAHVLNTIDEEENFEDDKTWKMAIPTERIENVSSDSEYEIIKTITLPTKKADVNNCAEKKLAVKINSPVDFWQQINKDSGRNNSTEAVVLHEMSTSLFEMSEASMIETYSLNSDVSSEDNEQEKIVELVESEATTSTSETSVSNRKQFFEDEGREEPLKIVVPKRSRLVVKTSVSDSDVLTKDVITPTSSTYMLDVTNHRKSEEDADSGITTLSADINQQTSEKDVNSGGSTKKYQRTCTHSRLFDFLQQDDYNNENSSNKKLMMDMLWSTSGYSSAATTPSTSSVGYRSNRYESDTARIEYDNYYNSWEHACPYFGYDILPSKAFKTIVQQQNGSMAVKPSTKFKCPKIPISRENET